MIPDLARPRIPAMSPAAVDRVRALADESRHHPQVLIKIDDDLHAGLYRRTAFFPKGALTTSVMIKIATLLIVSGDVSIFVKEGEPPMRVCGPHKVVPAEACRQPAFFAHADTYLTMMFATDATTVEEAERQFTDEVDLLQSRQEGHPCRA